MYRIILIATLLSATTANSAEIEHNTSFDIGLGLAPSFAPELGYKYSKIRTSVEFGISLYEYSPSVTSSETSLKLLRFGLGIVNTKPVVLFSPMSVYLKEKVYLSPTFGFGEHPYTIFTVAYELAN